MATDDAAPMYISADGVIDATLLTEYELARIRDALTRAARLWRVQLRLRIPFAEEDLERFKAALEGWASALTYLPMSGGVRRSGRQPPVPGSFFDTDIIVESESSRDELAQRLAEHEVEFEEFRPTLRE